MNRKIAPRYSVCLLAGLTFLAAASSAQTVAYRQTNLASSLNTPGFANRVNPALQNPSGVALVPGLALFVASPANGLVIAQDASGLGVSPGGFTVPSISGIGLGSPTAIAADPHALFASADPTNQPVSDVITATADGGIYIWGIGADGSFPTQATLVLDRSAEGAVYTGIAILTPECCAPVLAAANFHRGLIETFDTHLAPLGTIRDTSLPPGFAPFALQVVGNQLFVASALQDDARQGPVSGAGNGFVSVFDLQGNFIRRFAAGEALNAPVGIAQAGANFGPFSNAILVGNSGDGVINAFDFTTGNLLGQIRDGAENVIATPGLHALLFGSQQFGDPNTLYFVAGINGGQDGLFAAMSAGLVSVTSAVVPSLQIDTPATITVTVSAGAGNQGTPEGTVAVEDGGTTISTSNLSAGVATFSAALRGIGAHTLQFQYSGDANFLPSSSRVEVQVAGLATSSALTAPANAVPGSDVLLTATISSTSGIPTGQVVFQDGTVSLGSAPLDSAGVAVFRTNTLAAGTHSLTASYSGDEKFSVSASAAVTLNVVNSDFSLSASPSTATVVAGRSTQFMLQITPVGGFSGSVSFSCTPVVGITCAFNPASVTPSNGPANSTLTVTTSAGVANFRRSLPSVFQPRMFLLALLAIFTLPVAIFLNRKSVAAAGRKYLLPATAFLALLGVSVATVGCGKLSASVNTNRGTAQITVTAQSGAIVHTTVVSVTVQ